MNAEHSTTDLNQNDEATEIRRDSEKEAIWQQVNQHFQTTQTSLSLRLVCKGKVIQQVGDIKSGVREAARLFTLQDSPEKAEELIASQENLFNRKCQQWEQVAKSAEAQERAKATGGSGGNSATSAANRRRLESENNAVRNRISSSKQCFRRLRTALNRGVAYGSRKLKPDNLQEESPANKPTEKPGNRNAPTDVSSTTESTRAVSQDSKLTVCLQNLIGAGLTLEYGTAPFLDPFWDEGLRSREAIWTENQPYCLIVQWEHHRDESLNLRFWIVPKRPELVQEFKADELPELFLHTPRNNEAVKLNFQPVVHSGHSGPVTSEMSQLISRIESERFLSSELDQRASLIYLTCSVEMENDFDTAVQESYLLELL